MLVVSFRLSKVADNIFLDLKKIIFSSETVFLVNSPIESVPHGTKLNPLENSFGLFRDNLYIL